MVYIFKNDDSIKLSSNQDFSTSYNRSIETFFKNMKILGKNNHIEIRGKTISMDGVSYDVLMTSTQGLLSVYLESVPDYKNPDKPIGERKQFEINELLKISPEHPVAYIANRISHEIGLKKGFLNVLESFMGDDNFTSIQKLVYKNIINKDNETPKYPTHIKFESDIITDYGYLPDVRLLSEYMAELGYMNKSELEIFSKISKESHTQVKRYIPQLLIQHDYLTKLCVDNEFNSDHPYRFNDDDYCLYISDDNTLIIEDQNVNYEFIRNGDDMKIIGIPVSNIGNKNDMNLNSIHNITFDIKNDDIKYVDTLMFECLIMDMVCGIKKLEEDGYQKIEYPVDVTDFNYIKSRLQENGLNELDALFNIYTYGAYDPDTQTMSYELPNYLIYDAITIPESKNQEIQKPLFMFQKLLRNLDNLERLQPEWRDGLIKLLDGLKKEEKFGDVDKFRKTVYINMFDGLETTEKCDDFRHEILERLEEWNQKYGMETERGIKM